MKKSLTTQIYLFTFQSCAVAFACSNYDKRCFEGKPSFFSDLVKSYLRLGVIKSGVIVIPSIFLYLTIGNRNMELLELEI